MTRPISTDLRNHLSQEVTTIATCWKLTRSDNVVMGFTNHDKDIIVDGVTYKALTGMTTSVNRSNSDLSVDNMEIDSYLDSSAITEQDLAAGLYDFANIVVFIVNYNDLSMGKMLIRNGNIGEVTIDKQKYTAELRGLSERLNQISGRVVAPLCNAILGDSKCAVNLTSFTFSATVTAVIDTLTFKSSSLTQVINYFNAGKVTWVTGNNAGVSIDIKEFYETEIVLSLPMSQSIQVGDQFTIIAGCDKIYTTCRDKFNNINNFRGFPSVPGMNQLLTTAGTMQTQ